MKFDPCTTVTKPTMVRGVLAKRLFFVVQIANNHAFLWYLYFMNNNSMGNNPKCHDYQNPKIPNYDLHVVYICCIYMYVYIHVNNSPLPRVQRPLSKGHPPPVRTALLFPPPRRPLEGGQGIILSRILNGISSFLSLKHICCKIFS